MDELSETLGGAASTLSVTEFIPVHGINRADFVAWAAAETDMDPTNQAAHDMFSVLDTNSDGVVRQGDVLMAESQAQAPPLANSLLDERGGWLGPPYVVHPNHLAGLTCGGIDYPIVDMQLILPSGLELFPWNRNYKRAVAVFQSSRTLHSACLALRSVLYSGSSAKGRCSDLIELIAITFKNWTRPVFTFVINSNGRFGFSVHHDHSKDLAGFFKDSFSKHLVHSALAPSVVCAGEMWVEDNVLHMTNNSGTYAPPLRAISSNAVSVLRNNFPDLVVVAHAYEDLV